jgi:hypothetical protein
MRPGVDPTSIDSRAKAQSTGDADQDIENGDIGNSETTPASITADGDRSETERMRSFWPRGDIEDTDLERRVLAHERILQSLIAHMAEAEPAFIGRLSAVFSDPSWAIRREYDYTDTHAYADQFVQEVLRLIGRRKESDAAQEAAPPPQDFGKRKDEDAVIVQEGRAVTLLEVAQRAGIWEVTKDGRFYGHYTRDQPAFDAAEAAAFAIVAGGGAANVLWNDARPPLGFSDPARDASIGSIGVLRTLEFRAGSTRVVR